MTRVGYRGGGGRERGGVSGRRVSPWVACESVDDVSPWMT